MRAPALSRRPGRARGAAGQTRPAGRPRCSARSPARGPFAGALELGHAAEVSGALDLAYTSGGCYTTRGRSMHTCRHSFTTLRDRSKAVCSKQRFRSPQRSSGHSKGGWLVHRDVNVSTEREVSRGTQTRAASRPHPRPPSTLASQRSHRPEPCLHASRLALMATIPPAPLTRRRARTRHRRG